MIYFAQPTTGGPLKIGCSADVPARLRQFETHYGRPLALLAGREGSFGMSVKEFQRLGRGA